MTETSASVSIPWSKLSCKAQGAKISTPAFAVADIFEDNNGPI